MPRIDISGFNVGLGEVAPRPIIRQNIEAFANALDKIDANSKEAIEKRSAIDIALSQIELNPAEDEWKYNYAKRIRDSIDAYAKFGDYSQAVNAATTAAATAVSSPEITGRMRAQQAYKQFVEQTKARTDINQDIKDWALAQPENQYKYEDKYDNAYNIVGGTKWEAGRTPVTQVSLAQSLNLVKQWASANAGGGVTDVGFVGADGKITSDYSKGVYGMAYKRSGKWEVLPESKLREAWNAVLDSQPGLRASLQQDYDVAVWKFKQMTPEERANAIDSDVYDYSRNRLYSPREYLEKRVSPAFEAMAYTHSYNDIEFGDGLSRYAAAAGAARQNTMQNLYEDQIEQSKAIEMTGEQLLDSTFANLTGGINALRNLFPNLSKSKAFNNLLNQRDYNGLANLLSKNITSRDPYIRQEARKTINLLRDEGATYNKYLEKLTPDEKNKYEFNIAINTHSDLPANNPYTKAYWYNIDKAFRVGENNETSEMGYVCSGNDFTNIATAIGITKPEDNLEWQRRGFNIKKYNGRTVVSFDRNNRYIPDFMTAVMQDSGFNHVIGKAYGTKGFLRYDKDGNIQNRRMAGDSIQNAVVRMFGGSPDIDYNLESIYDNNVTGEAGGKMFQGILRTLANPFQTLEDIGQNIPKFIANQLTPGAGNLIKSATDDENAGLLANLAKEDSPGIDIFNGNIYTDDGNKINANPVQVANSFSKQAIKALNLDKVVDEMPIYEDTMRRMELWNKWENGEITDQQLEKLDKRYEKQDLENVLVPGLSSYNIFADNADGVGNLKMLSQEDKETMRTKLFNAYSQGLLEATGSWNPLNNTYGTLFRIFAGKDKDGNYTGAPQTVFVESLGATQSAREFQSDTNTRARHILSKARALGSEQITLDDGNKIVQIGNDNVTIVSPSGKKTTVSFEDGRRALTHSLNMQEAKEYMTSGMITTQEQLNNLVNNILNDAGITQNNPNYAGEFLRVSSEIINSVRQ